MCAGVGTKTELESEMVRRAIFFLGSIDVEKRETKGPETNRRLHQAERSNFAKSTKQKRVWMQKSCFETIKNKQTPSPLYSIKKIIEGKFLGGNAKRVERPDV